MYWIIDFMGKIEIAKDLPNVVFEESSHSGTGLPRLRVIIWYYRAPVEWYDIPHHKRGDDCKYFLIQLSQLGKPIGTESCISQLRVYWSVQ